MCDIPDNFITGCLLVTFFGFKFVNKTMCLPQFCLKLKGPLLLKKSYLISNSIMDMPQSICSLCLYILFYISLNKLVKYAIKVLDPLHKLKSRDALIFTT
jgi:uncharacterized membrane protein